MGTGVDTDIAIVGAGPSGSAAAIACAARGLKVVLFERSEGGGDRPGETLHPGIEPLLAQLGIAARLPEVVGARHSGIWIEWGGPRRFETFGGDAAGPWSGFQVRRSAFDTLMIQRAREAGVDVRQPSIVSDVLVAEGAVCGVATEAGPVTARMVIDASGPARWLGRRLGLAGETHSPRLVARYGYAEGSCPERDDAPALVGDASGWTWTAKVWGNTYQWTRLAFGDRRPEGDWRPDELRALEPRGPTRGADVTWRLVTQPAGPGWFIVGDAAATLDPASSHGVLKAIMTGTTAAHLAAALLYQAAPHEEAAHAYRHWLTSWFATDAARLRQFYCKLGVQGFA